MNRLIVSLLIATLFVSYGCSPKPDSNKVAEETNDSLVEQATPSQAERLAADSKANAKDVAEFMVAVADAGHTLGALSELGIERASSPAVKAFAQQALDQQREHESNVADVAQTYKIVLPRALSTDNETRVNRLRDEKAGSGFDKAYLRYMVDINDQAISKAKKLVDNADSPVVKNLALTISADDEKQMKEAEKLMDNL